jgi:hypothetical protein
MHISVPLQGARTGKKAVSSVSALRIGIWLAGLALFCFVYFLPRWHDWNQDARLDMTMALVNHGTIAINAYQWNTKDDDFFHGHYYSNKAPGQSLVGVPVYAVYKALLSLPPVRRAVDSIERDSAWKLALQDGGDRFIPPKLDFALLQYVESIVTVAIPAVLLLVLFYWFLGYFSNSLFNRALLTLALGLATMIFPYAQLFYSHIPAAALLFAGFVLVYIATVRSPKLALGLTIAPGVEVPRFASHRLQTTFLIFFAGLALGAAVVFEYPAIIISALICIYALLRLPRRLWPYLVLGTVPGILTVMGYDYTAYHNPFVTGYSEHSLIWKQEAEGIGGFTWPPHWDAIKGMSVSRYRGLFFLSPFLLLAFPGYVLWSRRSGYEWLLFLAAPVAFFFAIAMYWGWFAGEAVGPRYLIPMLPFLTLPIIFVLDRVRSWPGRLAIYALVAISVVNIWVETLGSRAYPHSYTMNPLFTYSLPALARGEVPLNLGTFAGLNGLPSLLPLAALLLIWSVATLVPALVNQRI